MAIFGVDIASGSPSGRRPPSYSVFALDGDRSYSYHMISRYKLMRLIRQRQPEIVALDNVHELASDRAELVRMLKQFPSGTKLVQVTGGEKVEALTKIAKWHGMVFDRLNPLEEAEACARLAAKGIGQALSAFEDRTYIKVSRRRSPGRGGWSQNRYYRKIHGAVKGLSREVEKQLREAGLDYTSRAVEGIGGYTRAEFVVDAPREKVHLNPGYYSDAQYRVEEVERPKLQFKPLVRKRGYIIVGLDPGTTTGIAALNLKGELIDLISSREISSSDVIEWIAARGNPLIVATDVFPTPGAVEKVKRSFNAVLYSPGADVPAEEKIALAKEYGYKNDHERDALAAASSAFKKYKNKFSQVEKKVPPEVDQEEVKALVVRGRSVENAVAELTPVPEEVAMPEAQHQPKVCASPDAEAVIAQKAQVQQLSEQVRTLRSYIEDLRSGLGERDDALTRMRQKLDRISDKASREIKRDHAVKIRDKEIERLRGLLRSERKYNKKLKKELYFKRKTEKVTERVEEIQGYKRLKPVEVFSKEAVSRATERWGISKGDLIFLENPSGGGPNTADLLMERGIEAVILEGEMSPAVRERFEEKGVPVFSSKDLPVRKIDGIDFVNPLEVVAAKERWAEEMKAMQAEKKSEWLEGIIQEYRTERKKEEKRKLRQ